MHLKDDVKVTSFATLQWVKHCDRLLWAEHLPIATNVNPAIHPLGWWHGRVHLCQSHFGYLKGPPLQKACWQRDHPRVCYLQEETRKKDKWGRWQTLVKETKSHCYQEKVEKHDTWFWVRLRRHWRRAKIEKSLDRGPWPRLGLPWEQCQDFTWASCLRGQQCSAHQKEH